MDPNLILTGIGIVVAIVIGVWQISLARKQQGVAAVPTLPIPIHIPSKFEAQAIGSFYLSREKVIVHVRHKYEPHFSTDMAAAFDELNEKRLNKGLDRYFAGQRFRPIAPPIIGSNSVEMEVTPLNYAFVALMKDEDTPLAVKQKVQSAITQAAYKLPKHLADDSYLFAQGYNLIGTGICLVTSDGYTLLRRRGMNVLRGNELWDLSVSGHPSSEDVSENLLDFASTVQRETLNEIGPINGDPRKIVFIGLVALHPNKVAGDMNLLAVWPIESSSVQLHELITGKRSPYKDTIFHTQKRARESYVWDTDNILVKFEGSSILQDFRLLNIAFNDFVPEALVGLDLALLSQNKGSLGVS